MRALGALLFVGALGWAGEVVFTLQRDGRPVEGVTVAIAGRQATSDARGHVRFEIPAGEHDVEARFPAAGPGRFGGNVSLGRITVRGSLYGVRLEVPRPRTVAGIVTDGATGRPLAGAKVVMALTTGEKVGETVAGEDGRFEFQNLAQGAARLTASRDGYADATAFAVTGRDWPVELAPLAPGKRRLPVRHIVAVRGNRPATGVRAALTFDDGSVVELADLPGGYLRVPPLDGDWLEGRALRRIRLSDQDGFFAEIGSAPGARRGFGGFEFVQLAGLSLLGRVLDASGQPVAGLTVLAASAKGARTASTSTDGRFTLRGLEQGAWRIDVADRELRPAAATPVDVSAETAPVEIRVAAALTLRGHVTGLDGNDRATVTCLDRSVATDERGDFVLRGVRPASGLAVLVTATGYQPGRVVVRDPGQPINVEIAPVVALGGVVRDASGRPLAGAVVTLAVKGGASVPRSARSNAEGRYRLPAVPVGSEVRVQVVAQGFAPGYSTPLAVRRGGGDVAPVVLQTAVAITGIVRDEKGRPVAGVVLAAEPAGASGWSPPFVQRTSRPSSTDGAFRIDGVAAGGTVVRLAAGDQPVRPVVDTVTVEAPARDAVFSVRRIATVDVKTGDGIDWSRDVRATLARARKENRPVLLAVNALDTETGNVAMAFRRYVQPELIAATRPFLCLVASPNDHGKHGGKPPTLCDRFGRVPCDAHKEVMDWAMLLHAQGGSLTSPNHFIYAPDGTLLFSQPFWIEADVLRRELEKAVVRVSPRRALAHAARARRDVLDRLEKGELDAKTYVKSGDPLAAAVLLILYEDSEDEKWLEPLAAAPREAFGLVRLYLEDDPALVAVAKAIDAERGAWWERFYGEARGEVPAPHDPELAAAWKKLQGGDKSGLERLLAAFSHPVDGPEVRACLVRLVGSDLGKDPKTWREYLDK